MNFIYIINLIIGKQHVLGHDMNNYLNLIFKFPRFSNEQSLEYEKCITEKKLFEALKIMPNDKSPGNGSPSPGNDSLAK